MVKVTEVNEANEYVDEVANELLADGNEDGEENDEDYEDVEDEDDVNEKKAAAVSDDDDDVDDEDDDEDNDEDDENFNESILERLYALRDAIPYEFQLGVWSAGESAVKSTWRLGRFLGQAGWVIATATALLVLPSALELEREAAAFAQEHQMRMQQQLVQQPGPEIATAK